MDTPDLNRRTPAEAQALAIRLMLLCALAFWIVLGYVIASQAGREDRACRARGGWPEYVDGYTVVCHSRPTSRGIARDLE
jgi:hypothetical protein